MSIYPDKKDGVVTGRWRVEVQLNGLRKRGPYRAGGRSRSNTCSNGSISDASAELKITFVFGRFWTRQIIAYFRPFAPCGR
jgi:hypothetical protein